MTILRSIAAWQARQVQVPMTLELLSLNLLTGGASGETLVYTFNEPISIISTPNDPTVLGINSLGTPYNSYFGGGVFAVGANPNTLEYTHTRTAPNAGYIQMSNLNSRIVAASGNVNGTSLTGAKRHIAVPTAGFGVVAVDSGTAAAGNSDPIVYTFNSIPDEATFPDITRFSGSFSPIAGTFSPDDTGTAHFYTRWKYVPDTPWVAGTHQIDFANNLIRAGDGGAMNPSAVLSFNIS